MGKQVMAEQFKETERTLNADETTTEQLRLDPEGAKIYLGRRWVHRAMRALREIRKAAGLTQDQVANHLSTTQSVVTRWESDLDGSMSLRNYERFARACGFVPMNIELRPFGGFEDHSGAGLDVV